jgi:hypothetical protein
MTLKTIKNTPPSLLPSATTFEHNSRDSEDDPVKIAERREFRVL